MLKWIFLIFINIVAVLLSVYIIYTEKSEGKTPYFGIGWTIISGGTLISVILFCINSFI